MLLYILLYSMYIYYFFGSFFFFFFLKHKLTCPLDEHMYCVNLSRRGKRRKNKPKCTCWALKLLKMCQNTADTTMCVIFWLVFLQWSSFLQQQILGFDRRKTFADTECKKNILICEADSNKYIFLFSRDPIGACDVRMKAAAGDEGDSLSSLPFLCVLTQ